MSDGGRIVGQGRFRVDRRRALEKMEAFQLEDPHRYVLEWVAAAVVSGAARIDVVNDADDLELRWAWARPPTADELDGLFDHLWGPAADDPRGATLQHLALGVLGALGLRPRWVHLDAASDAGDLRLAVQDPAETRHRRLDTHDLDGVRCHVREHVTQRTVWEALTAVFQEPAESHLIRGAARWCPVPVLVNGRAVSPPEPPSTAVLDATVANGRLWFAIGPGPGIDLVRHGIVVAHHAVSVPPFSVGGWWRAEDLRLNASRSQVVEDGVWEAATSALGVALDRVLRTEVAGAIAACGDDARVITWSPHGGASSARATRTELLQRLAAAAILRLCQRKKPLGALLDARALTDVSGTTHTLRELERHGQIGVARAAVDDPDLGAIVFVGDAADVVRAWRPDVADLTSTLEARAQGRQRRARLERNRKPPRFDRGPQREARHDRVQVAVRWRSGPFPARGIAVTRLRIDGIEVCTAEIDGVVGWVEAIADSPDLAADAAFAQILRNLAYTEAVAAVRREAHALAIERIVAASGGAPDPEVVGLATDLLALQGGKRVGADLADAIDPAVADAVVLQSGTGPRSTRSVLSDPEPWQLTTSVPPDCPAAIAARLLVLPAALHAPWSRWLGPRALPESALAARLTRARRLGGRPRPIALVGPIARSVPLSTPRLTGVVGVRTAAGSRAEVEVLRDRFLVKVSTRPLALAGVVGVVDGPELGVNEAHDDLTAEAEQEVRAAVDDAVDRLAFGWWADVPAGEAPPEALLDWLATRSTRGALAGAEPLVLAYRFDGRPVSVRDARASVGRDKAKLRLLRRPPGRVPGLSGAVPATPALIRALDAVAPKGWRDATGDLDEGEAALSRFAARARWVDPPSVASTEIAGDGFTGRLLLERGRTSGRVVVLWDDRSVVDVTTGEPGATLVVSGPGLEPSRTLAGLADPARLSPLQRRCERAIDTLLAAAVTRAEVMPAERGAAGFWLGWIAAFRGRADRRALASRIAALPVLHTPDGATVSLGDLVATVGAARVSRDLPGGPVGDGRYVYDEPSLSDAFHALCGRALPVGDDTVKAWRRGRLRLATAERRPPIVAGPDRVLSRAPLAGGGEVALLSLDGPALGVEGLRIEPLVDGVPLEPLAEPFPVPAIAVVTGDGVAPDPAHEHVVQDERWTRRVAEIRAALSALAERKVAAAARTKAGVAFAVAWVLASPGAAGAHAPLFALADGSWCSLAELDARAIRDGGIAVVAREEAVPGAVQPVVATGMLRQRLRDRFRLVVVPEPTPGGRAGGRPDSALDRGADGIRVLVGGRPVTRLSPTPGPVPLEGWIDEPRLSPGPLWDRVEPDAVWAEVLALVAARSRQIWLDAARQSPPPRWVLSTLMDWTAEHPDDPDLPVLLAAPLLKLSTGGAASIAEVLEHPPIRAVQPAAVGEPLPGRPPFVRADPALRKWLRTLAAVEPSDAALARETEGAQRRRAPVHQRRAPRGATTWAAGDVRGAVWLEAEPRGEPIATLVGGRPVGELGAVGRVAGATGWVDGPFPTNDAFTVAHVPAPVVEQVTEAVARLLQAEADRGPAGWAQAARRLLASIEDVPARELCAQGVWRDLVLFRDGQDQPLPLHALAAAVASGRLRFRSRDDPTVAPSIARLVTADRRELDVLERLLPKVELVRWEPPAVPAAVARQEVRAERARARRAEGGRVALVEALRALGATAEQAQAWAGACPDAEAERSEVERTLTAWGLAAPHLDGAEELRWIEAIAERLARAAPGS